MSATTFSIGCLAREAGVHVQTLRHYESLGLLTPSARTAGGQRRYSTDDRRRVLFIRHAREFGFSLERIREVLGLAASEDRCASIDALAAEQLDAVRERIRRLQALEQELERMVAQCGGGPVSRCRVLEVLGDHAHCGCDHGRVECEHTGAMALEA